MAEPHLPPAEVADYLLGRLTPAARRRFEARLADDAALRQSVRELEEGLVALALAAPQLKAPSAAWANIEAAIARPSRNFIRPPFWKFNWLTGGLAFAVCLTFAFFIHALWFQTGRLENKSGAANSGGKTTVVLALEPGRAGTLPATDNFTSVAHTGGKPPTNSPVAGKELFSSTASAPNVGSSTALRLSAPGGAVAHGRSRLSPKMQQAVLLAVARQIGWKAETSSASASGANSDGEMQVDFVDLPDLAAAPVLALAGLADLPPDFAALRMDPINEVPMVAWGSDLFVTLDPATLPADAGPVSVWAMDGDGNQRLIGTVNLGTNPAVITIRDVNTSGWVTYFVTVGGTNIFGQYPPLN